MAGEAVMKQALEPASIFVALQYLCWFVRETTRMIPKSGHRFSDKIMRKVENR